MKKSIKNIIFIAFSFFTIIMQASEQEPTKLFVGTIQFPEELNCNDLCLYYKGKKLVTEWDKPNLSAQFSFLESKHAQELYILISDDLSYQTQDDNTIQHLQVTNNKYKCYKITATRIEDEQGNKTSFSWNIADHKLKNNTLPDNTLIFLFDPKLVEELQVHIWNKNQTMRIVPTIKITKLATPRELMRTISIARIQAIDIDTIHAKEPYKVTKQIV